VWLCDARLATVNVVNWVICGVKGC
jgi:hypothetical protein